MAQLHGCLYAFFCEVFASTIGLIHVFLCERAGTIVLLSIASFYFCCEVSAINTILQDPSSKKDFFNILVDNSFYIIVSISRNRYNMRIKINPR